MSQDFKVGDRVILFHDDVYSVPVGTSATITRVFHTMVAVDWDIPVKLDSDLLFAPSRFKLLLDLKPAAQLGATCSSCNTHNEYQTAPYTCYGCRSISGRI